MWDILSGLVIYIRRFESESLLVYRKIDMFFFWNIIDLNLFHSNAETTPFKILEWITFSVSDATTVEQKHRTVYSVWKCKT